MTSGLKAKATLSERGDELCETPPVAVTALLELETLPSVVWEPACGPSAIVSVLRAGGHIATDLNAGGAPTASPGAGTGERVRASMTDIKSAAGRRRILLALGIRGRPPGRWSNARNPNPIIVDENGRLLAGARRLRQRPLRGRR